MVPSSNNKPLAERVTTPGDATRSGVVVVVVDEVDELDVVDDDVVDDDVVDDVAIDDVVVELEVAGARAIVVVAANWVVVDVVSGITVVVSWLSPPTVKSNSQMMTMTTSSTRTPTSRPIGVDLSGISWIGDGVTGAERSGRAA